MEVMTDIMPIRKADGISAIVLSCPMAVSGNSKGGRPLEMSPTFSIGTPPLDVLKHQLVKMPTEGAYIRGCVYEEIQIEVVRTKTADDEGREFGGSCEERSEV
jgi:hypothetical protein